MRRSETWHFLLIKEVTENIETKWMPLLTMHLHQAAAPNDVPPSAHAKCGVSNTELEGKPATCFMLQSSQCSWLSAHYFG